MQLMYPIFPKFFQCTRLGSVPFASFLLVFVIISVSCRSHPSILSKFGIVRATTNSFPWPRVPERQVRHHYPSSVQAVQRNDRPVSRVRGGMFLSSFGYLASNVGSSPCFDSSKLWCPILFFGRFPLIEFVGIFRFVGRV